MCRLAWLYTGQWWQRLITFGSSSLRVKKLINNVMKKKKITGELLALVKI
jgi:hypothetical protein